MITPIALIGSLRLVAGRLTNVVSAATVNADAAKWYAQGLPVVLAESPDEAQALADEAARRFADTLRAEWESRGIGTAVMTEREVALLADSGGQDVGGCVRQGELFAA